MIRLSAVSLAALATWLAAAAGPPPPPGLEVGVVVEETRGGSPAARRAARAEVAALTERGIDAELRVADSPSRALASAATLITRGARRLVLVSPDPDAVVGALRAERPGVRLDVRPRPRQSTAMTAPPRRGSAPPSSVPVTTSRSTAWAPPK